MDGASSGPGIDVVGVRRAFGSVVAVDDITLTAAPGEVTALVGPNGSGKTTLMLMLASLLAPDAGTIRIAGHDPVSDPTAVRRAVGWMPDGFGTWDALTVREVLHTIGAAYLIDKAAVAARTEELLGLLHLGDLADRRARVLSRGQKQRLGLARALIHDPTVLVLDEPASGLDPRSRIELRDVLRGLADEGKTVLVSSHILTELQEMADRAVIVAGGRTVGSETVDTDGANAVAAWRIVSLDPPRLADWLTQRSLSWRIAPGGVEVSIAGDHAAAELIRELTGDGIPITTFAPSQGALEAAYLAATEDRQ